MPAADGHIDACLIRLQSYIKEAGQDIYTPCTESELAKLKLMNVSHIENLAVRLQELAALWNESSQLSQLKCVIEVQSLIYDLLLPVYLIKRIHIQQSKKQNTISKHMPIQKSRLPSCRKWQESVPNTTVKALKNGQDRA